MCMGHQVSTEGRGERTVYRLRDEATGAEAAILPSFGFNLFDLRLPAAGQVRRIIYAREGWAEAPDRPGRNGTPVLFPFPNRINEGRFTFWGRSYEVPINHPPHAIHGFAIQAPWEVVDQGADDSGAFLTGRFQIARQAPEMLAHWPADAVLELRYSLSGRRL